ncbi:hypothetical protein [Myceligenerans pegani]|uniref:Uncharacterized protein n=1 Tax=Myceligenerans pegani TaxID=2776917 RepID=A0ABR9N396_9MICO|nr:hypothetical protein [Myceligenerans sp. TRM 65318]MBE1877583.1 hypothetical protein [Myceligenerans sp. TRM 65318]MBE3019854.1 hypothetical protein [Myceligenerans sp. TRM 65318]
MLHTAVQIAESTTGHAAELPFPPLAFGLIAFGTLVAGLLFTFAFRNVNNRHADVPVSHDDTGH